MDLNGVCLKTNISTNCEWAECGASVEWVNVERERMLMGVGLAEVK